MKGSQFVVRSSRLGMAFVMLMSLYANPAMAAKVSGPEDASLLPIETSNVNKSLIDELFGPNGPNNGLKPPKDNYTNIKATPTPKPSSQTQDKSRQTITNSLSIGKSNVGDDFKCNLFESVPYADILSAVNALNAAVTSPACSGDSRVNVQGILESNKSVADAVKELRGYVENPETIQAENAIEISNKVDLAIRSATSIANSFAQTDLLRKECREAMSAGQIATSINDILNGLTPFALMAATLTTGGAAAVPFIVGGSVITNAVGSMAKIIDDNGVKVEKADVRRAIVENTCQFIRLDQKYKFLIKSRQEQISKITSDLNASKRLFSAKIGGLSNSTSGLVDRKNALEKINAEITAVTGSARGQLELDKAFMKSTSDSIKICQLGIQLSILAKDKTSYVSQMLSTLDQAMVAYGSTSIAQAQALKMSSNLAIKSLDNVAANQFSSNVNYQSCAQATASFVETVDQSASLSKQLLKLAQDNIEKGLQNNKEYGQYKARLSSLNQKQFQADRVRKSLDKLQAYANTITQSEIDAEMSKLRNGLFNSSFLGASPVIKWFEYVNGLHRAEVNRFNEGLTSLRSRAYKMTASGRTVPAAGYPGYYQLNQKQIQQDAHNAKNLFVFNLKQLPLGTKEHENVCRELQDVWNHWTSSIDHLAASDAFCNMIEPYVYDNRSEDASIVKMCRGFSKNLVHAAVKNDIPSTIGTMKNDLVKNYTRDWALVIKKRLTDLACVDMNEDSGLE